MSQGRVSSAAELAAHIGTSPPRLLAIDGPPGAGKTTLARELAALLQVPCIHLDDYLNRHKGGFLDFLRYDEINAALQVRPAVIEGVCLLEALARASTLPDLLVYVHSPSSSDIVRPNDGLAREVSAYLQRCRPFDRADIIFAATTVHQRRSPSLESGRIEVDVAFIQAKTKIALALAAGGMLTLFVGLAVLLFGVSGPSQTLIKAAGAEISASGIGGVIMMTSVMWAYFAYKARPTYARTRSKSEKFDSDDRLLERIEHESSTQADVSPRRES